MRRWWWCLPGFSRASGGIWRDRRLVTAAGVGLVFAVHPLQVEAVAWMAERKTLLCAFFSLAAAGAYLVWARRGESRRWWWVTTGWIGLALLAKPMAITLPLALVALDVCPLHGITGRLVAVVA